MYLQLGFVFTTLFQIAITEKCVTPNNEEVECVPICSCEILIDPLFKAEQSDINEFVRKSKCEGRESDHMVCCGSTSRFLREKCVTPNNEEAECVSIYSCPILIDALKTKQSKAIEFVRQSKCEGRESDRMVCCGTTSGFLTPMTNKTSDKDKLIPDRKYCGYQHSDDYFRNETDIGINEFPWVAGLLYDYGNGTELRCSGSLISNRYVLTAALCIREGVPLVEVRLGEYNIYTGEDCTEDAKFYECSDPPQTFAIEKMIPHPQYENFDHNIGLVRLSKKVQYSDYIRPICLPTAGTMFAKPGDIMITSGWGIKSNLSGLTETKKKIYGKLITNEECASTYKFRNGNQLCIKEFDNNTDITCLGDIGGALMFSYRSQWHQEGILSPGGLYCYLPYSGLYSVYTKVVHYLDWITENIEP